LIDDNARLLAAAVRRVCRQRFRDLAPDAEQEVRLALWKRVQAGADIQHPASYVYKVALTTSLAVIRRYRPEREELVPVTAEPSEPRQAVALAGGRGQHLLPLRKLGPTRATGRVCEDERGNPLGAAYGEPERGDPAHRLGDECSALDFEGVE
jgi:hypothetical protein